jgi:uncharacterized protein (TIGR03435 family)
MRIEGPGEMSGIQATMEMFASALTRVLRRKLVDQTGLNGAYTFRLRFRPEQNRPRPGAETPADDDRPSIFTALQEQLGLALKTGRAPVEVVVVDDAAKPAEN